jgi:ribonucleoside-triphosphate reductase
MKICKRDGRLAEFDKSKIVNAVLAAFESLDGYISEYAKEKAHNISAYVEKQVRSSKELEYDVEKIQDMVEAGLMASKRKDVAREYITYRNERNRLRGNLIDDTVLDYLSGNSEYWNTENSNKNAAVVTTQRDYLAGIVSTDIAKRFLLPKDVCEAHDAGIIHQHDMDYMAQNALSNCCLINLEDMLQNGTMINNVKIEPPKSLRTATTIATQIITAVASSQYGK